MRVIEGIPFSFTLNLPYDQPNRNGVIYTKGAILKALHNIENIGCGIDFLPLNEEKYPFVGMVQDVVWHKDDIENKVIRCIVSGVIAGGGINYIIKETNEDGHVTDCEITSFSISER